MSLYESKGRAHPGGFREVSVADVAVAKGITLVDVREPVEFSGELGHIAGAQLVPLATVAAASASWPKDAEYVLVCKSGGRSAHAAMALGQLGFAKVMNLAGGMLAWNAAGLPIQK